MVIEFDRVQVIWNEPNNNKVIAFSVDSSIAFVLMDQWARSVVYANTKAKHVEKEKQIE